MKILLLEDESAVGETILAFLQRWNMDAVFAQTPREALEILGSDEVDLLISDLMIPEMKGTELLKKLRRTTDPDKKEQVTAQLRDLISQRFDLIIKRKEIQYQRLLKQLEELKGEVKTREAELAEYRANKDQHISSRIEDLVQKTERFEWD